MPTLALKTGFQHQETLLELISLKNDLEDPLQPAKEASIQSDGLYKERIERLKHESSPKQAKSQTYGENVWHFLVGDPYYS